MRTIMKNPRTSLSTVALRLLIALAIVLALSAQSTAQTPGGTTISNQASATVTATGTITNMVIDVDNSGTINGGDPSLMGVSAVDSAAIAQNASIHVLVEVSVSAGATAGQTVQVVLGDAGGASPFDNQPV